MQSMTGFGAKEKEVAPFGKIHVELRSINHKFLETVFHLPEGFLSLEEKIRKELERKIKRGRVSCAISVVGTGASSLAINKLLLKNYLASLRGIKKQFGLKDEPTLDMLMHLPGVLSYAEARISSEGIWPKLKPLVAAAMDELLKTRKKEGTATYHFLKKRANSVSKDLLYIKARFKAALASRLQALSTDEERASFVKDTDISEEIERLSFHIRNFTGKLSKSGPIGKELDFVAQEMQREANTLAAKSFDVNVSSRVIQIKSQVEKIREQVQNVE